MREIKFRAWDGKEMHYNVCINHEGKAIKYEYRATDYAANASAGIPMQYTGLKDKHGQEIYEGDKVKILYSGWESKSDNDRRSLEQYLSEIASEGVVIFIDAAFMVRIGSDIYGGFFVGPHGYIEVIGNIHEPGEARK